VDEAEIHTDSLYELVLQMHFAEERGQKIVVQCPALCHDVIHFKPYNPAIVMMIRNIDDIHASERRIGWWFNDLEAIKYWDWTEQERPMGDIARLKYDYWWLVCQEWKEDSWFEVEYESLSAHPLWVPKEERKDFDAWQTEIEPEETRYSPAISCSYCGTMMGVARFEQHMRELHPEKLDKFYREYGDSYFVEGKNE